MVEILLVKRVGTETYWKLFEVAACEVENLAGNLIPCDIFLCGVNGVREDYQKTFFAPFGD